MNYYAKNASSLCDEYDALKADNVHREWKDFVNDNNGLALDVGAGSGRDARWMADNGWDVVAVEPCNELRNLAIANSLNSPSINWTDDKLPSLEKVRALDYKFNLIIVSAVWMHIPSNNRARVFRILTELLAPSGVLIITLRHGSNEKENKTRDFYEVSRSELEQLARQRAVVLLSSSTDVDQMNRKDVKWETCIFQLPDDGTGNLPLLRHIIVNDNKASTYKLGLLRALIKIAEAAPGIIIKRTDEFVTIPLGLVALYWIKLYIPLVLKHKLIQSGANDPSKQLGLGFAKQSNFYAMSDLSPYDLRIGSVFTSNQAAMIIGTLNDVSKTIKEMPAKYTTYPGTKNTIFQCERRTVKFKGKNWQINKESLSEFGLFNIPTKLWSTMGNFACWIEPTIVNEWVRVMMGYELRYDQSIYDKAMEWEEGRRDTSVVRKRINNILDNKFPLKCVWSDIALKSSKYHVDHCFPWSRWSNNDLWNLMPTSGTVNLKKSEKLPSAALMERSKSRILSWWDEAYLNSSFKDRFLLEAEIALPGLDSNLNMDNIFVALKHQRTRLKVNQQLVEWNG